MLWLVVVQWLHVFLGVLWFGGTLYINLILIPAVMPLPRKAQQEIAARVSPLTTRILRPTAVLVIALGFLRGTVLGPLHSVEAVVGTPYGVTWLTALLGALVLFAFTERVLDPHVGRLNTAKGDAEYAATLQQVKVLSVLQLLGFFAIFTCMMLLRFGL